MYVTPNGMIFRSFNEAMDYNLQEIEKEIRAKSNAVCPKCKSRCFQSGVNGVYICGNCFTAFLKEEESNESKNQRQYSDW